MRSFVAAVLAAVAFARPPALPLDWSSDLVDRIDINQGGVIEPNGYVCCPPRSPDCKVQSGYSQGPFYFDFTNNRTASLNPDGSGVVQDFNEHKEYAVDASKTCTSYCPLEGKLEPLGFGGPNVTVDEGNTIYNGLNVTDYRWNETIPFFNLTMQVSDFYIFFNGSVPYPVAEIDQLTPFGIPLGVENTTYVNYIPGPQDPSNFIVLGNATCPKNPRCGKNSVSSSTLSAIDSDNDAIVALLGRGLKMPGSSRRSVLAAETKWINGRPQKKALDAETELAIGMIPDSYALPQEMVRAALASN